MMSLWRAIWNGPFYVGPLRQPISSGAAILKMLEVLWRAGVCAALAAVALFGLLLGAAILQERQQAEDRKLSRLIEMDAGPTEQCPGGVQITVLNPTGKTLTHLTYTLSGYTRRGELAGQEAYLSWFTDIPPRSSGWLCRYNLSGLGGGAAVRFVAVREFANFR